MSSVKRGGALFASPANNHGIYHEHGLVGAVPRTSSGPEDPVWHEYPERLQRANAVFLGNKP